MCTKDITVIRNIGQNANHIFRSPNNNKNESPSNYKKFLVCVRGSFPI